MLSTTKQTVAIGTVVGGIAGTAIYVVTPTWDKDKRALATVLGGMAIGTIAAGVTSLYHKGVDITLPVSIFGIGMSTTGLVVTLLRSKK